MNKIDKASKFVAHIEKHLEYLYGKGNAKVMCKICGKTIDEICNE